MAFLPDIKSLDKLLSNEWKIFLYGEKSETWDDRFYSIARQVWSQILTFLDSQGRQFQNYWPLYAAFCVVSFIVLATYKSLRYVGTIKLRKADKCERQVKQRISTEGSRIVSDDGNSDTSSFVEKPCPTSRSDLDNPTPADNDFPEQSQHDSSVSSATTIVAFEDKQSGEFLRNLINSIEPGSDAMNHITSTKQSSENAEENQEISDLSDSTRQKMDSNRCKSFYHLTPWIGPPEEQQSPTPKETILRSSTVSTDDTKTEPLTHENLSSCTVDQEEIVKMASINLDPVNSSSNDADQEEIKKPESTNLIPVNSSPPKNSPSKIVSPKVEKSSKQIASESANSTLAIQHESSSICCADEVLSEISNTGEKKCPTPNNKKPSKPFTPKIELQGNNQDPVFINMVQKLPELDLSPISKEISETKIDNEINIKELETRTDSKHRFRSLSHDNRTVSCAGYVDNRRGCSVSPPARTRTKNIKQRPVKQTQSKIPTPSSLAHRQISEQLGTDGTVAETANHIRSVLLRKLKEVWEHHPRDRTPSPNRSIGSQNSSIYYTPENVSKIPLLRRSPRRSDTNDQTRSPRVSRQSDRLADQAEESSPGDSKITNESNVPVGVPPVLLHSTPKTSPSGRIHRR